MNRQSIEILYNAANCTSYNNHGKRLVITVARETNLIYTSIGSYLSFEDLTSEDFFELYRYKKSLENKKERLK